MKLLKTFLKGLQGCRLLFLSCSPLVSWGPVAPSWNEGVLSKSWHKKVCPLINIVMWVSSWERWKSCKVASESLRISMRGIPECLGCDLWWGAWWKDRLKEPTWALSASSVCSEHQGMDSLGVCLRSLGSGDEKVSKRIPRMKGAGRGRVNSGKGYTLFS